MRRIVRLIGAGGKRNTNPGYNHASGIRLFVTCLPHRHRDWLEAHVPMSGAPAVRASGPPQPVTLAYMFRRWIPPGAAARRSSHFKAQ